MFTVSILVNGEPILTRSAVNRLKEKGGYVVDTGELVKHDPNDGAVSLAKKLLDTIDTRVDRG